MNELHPEYIIDNNGNKKAVILSIEDFEQMIEALEDFEDVKLYDTAKLHKETSYPLDEAFRKIEANRKKGL